MKNSKVIPFLVAVLMLIMAVPANAAGESNGNTVEFVASALVPDIIVVSVPGNADVVINPFEIPVEINGESVTDQIITEPVSIQNLSAAPVSVSVSLIGSIKAGSNMAMVSASTKTSTSRLKKAFIYFEIQAADDPDHVAWDAEYDAEKHIVLRGTARTKKNIVTLDAGDENAPSGNKCYGAFRLTGDCIANPKQEWTEEDGIDAKVAFTFTLLPNP